MARASTLLTKYPNGVAQFLGFAPGGAAGNLTVVGGIAVGDRLLSVVRLTLGALGGSVASLTAATDLTSEFTVAAANTINNTAGTATTGGIVLVTFAKAAGND